MANSQWGTKSAMASAASEAAKVQKAQGLMARLIRKEEARLAREAEAERRAEDSRRAEQAEQKRIEAELLLRQIFEAVLYWHDFLSCRQLCSR
jgi:hypothetical protein